MKLYNWIFSWTKASKLKMLPDFPAKMKVQTELLKANCVSEVLATSETLWLSIKEVAYRLGIKSVQNNRSRIDRDEFGRQSILPNPLYSQNQVSLITKKYWAGIFTMVGFIIPETALYSIAAGLFVPGASLYLKLCVSLFMASVVMVGIDFSADKHFRYRDMVSKYEKKEITASELKKHRDLRNLGYVIMIFSLAAIVFSGLCRIFFLEYIPAHGLTPEKFKSVQRASAMGSLFTMAITIVSGTYLGIQRLEHHKISVKFRVFQYWHKTHVKRNKYTQSLIRDCHKLLLVIEQCAGKYWELALDLKEILHMEYDFSCEKLNQEYVALKSKPGFTLSDATYLKFSPLMSGHEELFRYAVMNSPEIKEKTLFITSILRLPEEHLAEHLGAVSKHMAAAQGTSVLSTNGKSKEHEFIIP